WRPRIEDFGPVDRRVQLFRGDAKHQRRWRRARSGQACSARAFAGGSGRLTGSRLDEDRVLQPLGRLFRRPGAARFRRAHDCRRGDAHRCLARPRVGSSRASRRRRGPGVAFLRPDGQRTGSDLHRRGRVLEQQMTQSPVPRWRNTPPLWRHAEALLFAGVFVYTTWGLAAGLVHYARETSAGQGFIADLLKPFRDGNYHDSVLAVVGLLITLLTLWELRRFCVTEVGKERAQG